MTKLQNVFGVNGCAAMPKSSSDHVRMVERTVPFTIWHDDKRKNESSNTNDREGYLVHKDENVDQGVDTRHEHVVDAKDKQPDAQGPAVVRAEHVVVHRAHI